MYQCRSCFRSTFTLLGNPSWKRADAHSGYPRTYYRSSLSLSLLRNVRRISRISLWRQGWLFPGSPWRLTHSLSLSLYATKSQLVIRRHPIFFSFLASIEEVKGFRRGAEKARTDGKNGRRKERTRRTRRTEGWLEGWKDRRKDGWKDGRMEGRSVNLPRDLLI